MSEKATTVLVLALLIAASGAVGDSSQVTEPDASPGQEQTALSLMPELGDYFAGDRAITTSLEDALPSSVPFLDDFQARGALSIDVLPEGPNGGLLLRPGIFSLKGWSYCLGPGKFLPGEGDGYLFAELKGPRAHLVRNILRRSTGNPKVHPMQVQFLLLAVLDYIPSSSLSPELKRVAAELLTPEELAELDLTALAPVPAGLYREAMDQLPPAEREVFAKRVRLRSLLQTEPLDYWQIEELALPSGKAPSREDAIEIPAGRWSFHPDGYFLHFTPYGSHRLEIRVSYPERHRILRDGLGRIVKLEDETGNFIEAEYDDSLEDEPIPHDPKVSRFHFKKLRFGERFQVLPDASGTRETEWEGVGWTLAGVPDLEPGVEPPAPLDPELRARHKAAHNHLRELQALDRAFGGAGPHDDAIDLFHLSAALEEVVGDREPGSWPARHTDLVKTAWQDRVARRQTGETRLAAPEYLPFANVAVPGNPARQLAGGSNHPDPCEAPRRELLHERLMRQGYMDRQLMAALTPGGADKYGCIVDDLAERVIEDGGNTWIGWLKWPKDLRDALLASPCEVDGDRAVFFVPSEGCPMPPDFTWEKERERYIEWYGPQCAKAIFKAHETHELKHQEQCCPKRIKDVEPSESCPAWEIMAKRIAFARYKSAYEIPAYGAGIDNKRQGLAACGCP